MACPAVGAYHQDLGRNQGQWQQLVLLRVSVGLTGATTQSENLHVWHWGFCRRVWFIALAGSVITSYHNMTYNSYKKHTSYIHQKTHLHTLKYYISILSKHKIVFHYDFFKHPYCNLSFLLLSIAPSPLHQLKFPIFHHFLLDSKCPIVTNSQAPSPPHIYNTSLFS